MQVIADVEPVVLVTLVGVALLVVVIAVALIVVARVLAQVSRRLEAIVEAVGEMPPTVEPAQDVLASIASDLEVGRDLLDGLHASKDAERK